MPGPEREIKPDSAFLLLGFCLCLSEAALLKMMLEDDRSAWLR